VPHTLTATLAVTALALTACGSSDDPTTATTATTVTTAPAANDAAATTVPDEDDVHFAQAMIAHHEQAIEMSEIALDPTVGAGAEVAALATTVRGAQDAEVDLMAGWLEAWGEPLAMDGSDGHDMSDAGMMTPEDMNDLAAAAGPEFDTAWLEMMILHHRGAISMSEEVQAEGTDPALQELAAAIIAAQTAEIARMEGLLAE
jgi:uncharacterized protein (DUF305 family)